MENWRKLEEWRKLDPDATFAILAAVERAAADGQAGHVKWLKFLRANILSAMDCSRDIESALARWHDSMRSFVGEIEGELERHAIKPDQKVGGTPSPL